MSSITPNDTTRCQRITTCIIILSITCVLVWYVLFAIFHSAMPYALLRTYLNKLYTEVIHAKCHKTMKNLYHNVQLKVNNIEKWSCIQWLKYDISNGMRHIKSNFKVKLYINLLSSNAWKMYPKEKWYTWQNFSIIFYMGEQFGTQRMFLILSNKAYYSVLLTGHRLVILCSTR